MMHLLPRRPLSFVVSNYLAPALTARHSSPAAHGSHNGPHLTSIAAAPNFRPKAFCCPLRAPCAACQKPRAPYDGPKQTTRHNPKCRKALIIPDWDSPRSPAKLNSPPPCQTKQQRSRSSNSSSIESKLTSSYWQGGGLMLKMPCRAETFRLGLHCDQWLVDANQYIRAGQTCFSVHNCEAPNRSWSR